MRQRIVTERPFGMKRRPAIELRNQSFQVPTLSWQGEGNIGRAVNGKACFGPGGVVEPEHAWKIPNTRTGRSHQPVEPSPLG